MPGHPAADLELRNKSRLYQPSLSLLEAESRPRYGIASPPSMRPVDEKFVMIPMALAGVEGGWAVCSWTRHGGARRGLRGGVRAECSLARGSALDGSTVRSSLNTTPRGTAPRSGRSARP